MSISQSPGSSPVIAEPSVSRHFISFYIRGWILYFLEYLPGIALLVLLALLARFVGRSGSDSYYVLYAILLGIVVRNLLGRIAFFEPGTRTYEVFWKAGIVLLGSQMGLERFREVGFKGLALATVEVVGTIAVTLFLTRVFKVPGPLRYLLAIGMGICGVSAVVALASIVGSDDEDTGYAVSVILIFGLLTLTFMPLLGRLLRLSDFHFGLWAGLSVNNTAEAVATGFVYSEKAGHYSTIAKLCRNAFLGVALLYFVQQVIRERLREVGGSTLMTGLKHFPKFALGLVLFSVLATFHFWSTGAQVQLQHLYRWAFLLGFAGVGLRTDLGRLRRRGWTPLMLAFGIQTLILSVMLGCVLLTF